MKSPLHQLLEMAAIVVAVFALAFNAQDYANNGRYQMIGATPRGVAIFDTVTGDTEVRRPLPFPSTTTTTEPEETP